MKKLIALVALFPLVAVASEPSQRLDTLEKTIESKIDRDAKAYQQARHEYWSLIHQSGDYARAYRFNTALAEQHPRNADALGDSASSIGGYIGWSFQNGAPLAHEELAKLDEKARAQYQQSLQIDPENFWTLYGLAMYESYSPGGRDRAKEVVHKLDALRGAHPSYPWHLVDELKQQLGDQAAR